MRIALIAHDKMKDQMVQFCQENEMILKYHELVATGTTGLRINSETHLKVHRLKSGPLGGDQEIGAMIANQKLDMVFFFRDPLTAQPHEPDITALLRLSDVYQIPLATNISSAQYFIKSLRLEILEKNGPKGFEK